MFTNCPVDIIQQTQDEFAPLLEIYKAIPNKRVILEVGIAYGGSLWFWIQNSPEGMRTVAIDIAATSTRINAWNEWAKEKKQELIVLPGDSTDPMIIETARYLCSNIDFLFIDGGHSLEVVSKDFYNYFPLVKDGGVIALHDINNTDYLSFGTKLFWDKIKSYQVPPFIKYKTQEIITMPDRGGIGIIYKG